MRIKDILKKYHDCDTLCLTRGTYKCRITKEEYLRALFEMQEKEKKDIKRVYNKKKFVLKNYPKFSALYRDIDEECREYFEKNKNRKRFRCTFIADELGKNTKYGDEYDDFFWGFYFKIALQIDRENGLNYTRFNKGKAPIKFLPKEIRDDLIKYEISFTNAVMESAYLIVNYYFKLNANTKKYLLKYNTDFDLDELQDLTLYKKDKVCFSSCTHEGYNSLEDNE